jgi:hypothetical protein
MATTILPKKSGFENPIATDDNHHEQLAADPSIQQFPQGSTYGSSSFGGASTFSTPSSGGISGGFGSSSNSGFGGTTNIGTQINQAPQQQMNLTQAGSNAAQGADVLVAHDKDSTDWINKKWRPAMGWLYMLTCFFDFVIFPVLWSVLQAMSKGQVTSQWQPLTLQGAGLYHIAMGAVLGIAAYGRTKEKIEGAAK